MKMLFLLWILSILTILTCLVLFVDIEYIVSSLQVRDDINNSLINSCKSNSCKCYGSTDSASVTVIADDYFHLECFKTPA